MSSLSKNSKLFNLRFIETFDFLSSLCHLAESYLIKRYSCCQHKDSFFSKNQVQLEDCINLVVVLVLEDIR